MSRSAVDVRATEGVPRSERLRAVAPRVAVPPNRLSYPLLFLTVVALVGTAWATRMTSAGWACQRATLTTSGAIGYSPAMAGLRWLSRLRLVALSGVAFFLAHDLVFLATYRGSYAEMLARTGHGEAFTASATGVALLSAAVVGAAVLRLVHLAREARRIGAVLTRTAAPRRRDVLRAAGTILLLTLAIFLIVENAEHLFAGLPAPGLGVLGSAGYQGTIPIVALIAGVLALVEALYRCRRDVLVREIAAARSRWPRIGPISARPRRPRAVGRPASVAGRRLAGRAPPAPVGL